jgi:amino acid permease
VWLFPTGQQVCVGDLVARSKMSETGYGAIPTSKKQRYSKISDLPDHYSPSYDSPDRVSSVVVGIFNVLNTCVGGGTLSIPFAFSKCGWGVATTAVFVSMMCTIFSMRLLCTLARKLGCATYSDVMEKTLGNAGKRITTALLFGMLFLVIIAFLVLMKDIAGDIVQFFTPESYVLTDRMKNLIVTVLTALCFPLMTADHLHSLRYISYAGTICVLILLYSIASEAYVGYKEGTLGEEQLRFGPSNSSDIFIGLPIIFISFLCQFNVIGVFSDLNSPNDQNMGRVINISMTVAAVLFTSFGFVGYLFASNHTQDNILKNFSPRDPSLLIARIGLTLTLLCQLPMVVLPCRKAFYPLVWPTLNTAENHSQHIDGRIVELPHPSSFYGEEDNLIKSSSLVTRERCYSASSGMEGTVAVYVPVDEGYDIVVTQSSSRYLLTFGLVVLALFISQAVPGVSTVWSIAGSTLSIIIAFLLPSYAYISLWRQLGASRESDPNVMAAYGLFIFSIFMIIVCTFQTMLKIYNP